jgi:hypothetical protein
MTLRAQVAPQLTNTDGDKGPPSDRVNRQRRIQVMQVALI